MKEKELRSCKECERPFVPKAHNSIYCGPECRRVATNKKVLSKYHERKARQASKKKRICTAQGCKTVLSRYNPEIICEWHITVRLQEKLISWGWDEEKVKAEWIEK